MIFAPVLAMPSDSRSWLPRCLGLPFAAEGRQRWTEMDTPTAAAGAAAAAGMALYCCSRASAKPAVTTLFLDCGARAVPLCPAAALPVALTPPLRRLGSCSRRRHAVHQRLGGGAAHHSIDWKVLLRESRPARGRAIQPLQKARHLPPRPGEGEYQARSRGLPAGEKRPYSSIPH